ncbi:hypothetical protein MLD38_040724 [Melastoma candidum]|nr:hypothetical protein MLD38_040724 [Melastoma candidum]
MDFLSHAWCGFAVHTLRSDDRSAIVLLDPQPERFESLGSLDVQKMHKSLLVDDPDVKSLPAWKSNDVKSWIWMQQAMHPEINYSSCFRKKWAPWKSLSVQMTSIKKWLKEMKSKRKEEGRLQRAEAHAALSVAGLAAALAAIAAESSGSADSSDAARESALASAAALVASQCAQVAEAMGANKEQLSSAIKSAMMGTSVADIMTLAAAATTSLRGAATLRARFRYRNAENGNEEAGLPIGHNKGLDHDFEKRRTILAQGMKLGIEMMDGRYKARSVSIMLNKESKVIIKIAKLNLLKNTTQSMVLDMHVELYEDSEEAEDTNATCYLVVLSTNTGTIKLDFSNDYKCYQIWSATITEMLMVSGSRRKCNLRF